MAFQKYIIENLLYPSMERIKGNRIRDNLRDLEYSQYGDNAELIRSKRLSELLMHCKHHVPAYRDIHATDDEIYSDPFTVLNKSVPVLQKCVFQHSPDNYLADNFPPEIRISNCTGGSTGEPIHFFMTRQQVERYEAARWRGLSWYGITPGSRSIMIWGSPIELSGQAQLANRIKDRLLKNRRILSAYDLKLSELDKNVRFIERYKPEYLYGYATILTAFAQMLEQRNISLSIPLKAVVSTSETLEEWQIQLIQRAFRCTVANEYGARDAGILAYTCPHGSLHITAENCIIEVLDPITYKPLPKGESGIIAVTDLTNLIQPRLRYLLGDIGAISTQKCTCGRSLPLLSHVDGREDDLLIGRNNTFVHGNVIGQLLRPLDGLRAFQFRQHTPTSATLFLVKASPTISFDEDEIRAKIFKVLPDTSLTISYVSEIKPTASGKQRYAIREFPLS